MHGTRSAAVLAALLIGVLLAAAATSADAAPRKHVFAVEFTADWGVLWHVRGTDGEPHDVCLLGEGAEGSSELDVRTRGRGPVTARLYADAGRGVVFGSFPVRAALRRTLTMGGTVDGCAEEHAESAGRLDCDDGDPQWGRFGNPPAFVDVAAGGGVVSVEVRRPRELELIERVWDFCPFWGAGHGRIAGRAKLSTRKLLSGEPQTVSGRARQDVPAGGGEHAQEGSSSWRLTIRSVGPR